MTSFLATVRSCVLDNLLSTTSRSDTPDQLSFAYLNVLKTVVISNYYLARAMALVPGYFFAYFYVCTGPKHLSDFSKKIETTKFLRTNSKQIFVLYMKSNVLLLVVILATATSLLHCLSMKVTVAVILHCFLTTFSRIFRF